MRLLLYTNLFPSDDAPRHGIFVAERLRQLLATGDIEAEVCALRPHTALGLNGYPGGVFTPKKQARSRYSVSYVPVPTLPLVTNWVDPLLWARASRGSVRQMADDLGEGAILDAHFLYPDGVAAVILGQSLGIPVVMTARGSDVNVKARNPVMRRWIRWAAERSAAVIAVSADLAAKLRRIGVDARKLHVLPNGVDLEKFSPSDGSLVRNRFGLTGSVIASVGNLIEGKGHHLAIEALDRLPGVALLIVGEGPDRQRLERLADSYGVSERVRFAGLVPQDEINEIYSAADITVLASANEGMPNVLLESIACGTPVVATNVGGVSEIVTAPMAGRIMSDRSADALASAAGEMLDAPRDRSETREFARQFGWQGTIRRQLALYEQVASR